MNMLEFLQLKSHELGHSCPSCSKNDGIFALNGKCNECGHPIPHKSTEKSFLFSLEIITEFLRNGGKNDPSVTAEMLKSTNDFLVQNINEVRNFMLYEYHFPYAVFLQGSNFATETVQIFKPDGSFVEIRHDSGAMNRIDRVTAANYCMKINCNYCKNIFIGHNNSSIMLQAASIYAKCDLWEEDEMQKIMMDIANTSIGILNQLG